MTELKWVYSIDKSKYDTKYKVFNWNLWHFKKNYLPSEIRHYFKCFKFNNSDMPDFSILVWHFFKRFYLSCYLCSDQKIPIQIFVLIIMLNIVPAGIYYMIKVNNGETRTICEVCPKLTIKRLGWRQWHLSDVIIVNFDLIWHIILVSPLLTLNK